MEKKDDTGQKRKRIKRKSEGGKREKQEGSGAHQAEGRK
jgi:hypothetical protein